MPASFVCSGQSSFGPVDPFFCWNLGCATPINESSQFFIWSPVYVVNFCVLGVRGLFNCESRGHKDKPGLYILVAFLFYLQNDAQEPWSVLFHLSKPNSVRGGSVSSSSFTSQDYQRPSLSKNSLVRWMIPIFHRKHFVQRHVGNC